MIILDTDVLSIIQRAEGQEYENLARRLDTADDEVFVTIISFEEQMRGWLAFVARGKSSHDYMRGYQYLHAMLDDFATRPILDFDQQCATEFDGLTRLRIRIGTMDLKIAGMAISHDGLLLSKNLTDFRKVPGLRVDDWS